MTEHGMEAFCLYLIRRGNAEAFIKAFCEQPEALVRGFAKAEKILRTLRVSELLLLPRFYFARVQLVYNVFCARFQVHVNEELSGANVEIIEIRSNLTQRMKMMQLAVIGMLETSMHEICRDNSVTSDS